MEIKRNEERRFRNYSALNKEAYLNDLNLINWNSIFNGDNGARDTSSDLNILTAKVVDTLTHVVNKHAPVKLASRSKNKLLAILYDQKKELIIEFILLNLFLQKYWKLLILILKSPSLVLFKKNMNVLLQYKN